MRKARQGPKTASHIMSTVRNREEIGGMNVCMSGAQLPFSVLVQSRTETQGMVLSAFSLGIPISIKAARTVLCTPPPGLSTGQPDLANASLRFTSQLETGFTGISLRKLPEH